MTWLTRWRRVRVPAEVPAPVGVKIRLRDGRLIPVDCLYAGLDHHRVHMWTIVMPSGLLPAMVNEIKIAELPARTGVGFSLEDPPP